MLFRSFADPPPAWRDGRGRLLLGIDHSAIAVSDTATSEAFYAGLGFARTGGSLNQGREQDRLDGLDEALEEAAADLGAPPARAFRQITLPLIASALIAGGLLSFTLCLDNAVISTLISEAGSTTFPVALLGATRSTIKPFWGVGAMILFCVTMGSLWFVAVVLRRSGSSSSDIAATLTGS